MLYINIYIYKSHWTWFHHKNCALNGHNWLQLRNRQAPETRRLGCCMLFTQGMLVLQNIIDLYDSILIYIQYYLCFEFCSAQTCINLNHRPGRGSNGRPPSGRVMGMCRQAASVFHQKHPETSPVLWQTMWIARVLACFTVYHYRF